MATAAVDLARREEEVTKNRFAVLKDREDRAKRLISMMLDLFDTYSPTDIVVYEAGIYPLVDEIYGCYVAFGVEESVNRFDVYELQSDECFIQLDESDPLIKQMEETNEKLKGFNGRIIDLAYEN